MIMPLRFKLLHGPLIVLVCILLEQALSETVVNITPFASLKVSSTLTFKNNTYHKEYAYDGRMPSNNVDSCNCCFSSDAEVLPFLELDMPGHFEVLSIEIFGRTDHTGGSLSDPSDLKGIHVLLDKRAVVVKVSEDNTKATVYPPFGSVKNIVIEKPNEGGVKWFLMICELKIIARALNIAAKARLEVSSIQNSASTNNTENVTDINIWTCFSSSSEVNPHLAAKFTQETHVTRIVIEGVPNEQGKCSPGYYGDLCTKSCGNCARSGVCGWDGSCLAGCTDGFQGDTCHDACSSGKFGANCMHHCYCNNQDACDKSTGRCENGCDVGWIGDSCSTACQSGTFGPGCLHKCHCLNGSDCDTFNGSCPGQCDHGWMGNNCSLSCSTGTFGSNCVNHCHCASNDVCDKASGVCYSCAIGWTGANCLEACPDGTYGQGCKYTCNCKNNQPCNKVDGRCPNGCDIGWIGQTCNKSYTLTDAISMNCSRGFWNIWVNMTTIKNLYPTSRAADIYLGENSCTGKENAREIEFHKGLDQCLTSQTVQNGIKIYHNELIYAQHDPVHPFLIRSINWTVPVECEIDKQGTSQGHLHFMSSTATQTVNNKTYTVSMKYYEDPNYMIELRGNPLSVPIGTQVYVKVFTRTADWGVKMIVDTCYTKPEIDAQDHLKVDIIKHGCEVDSNTHFLTQTAHETSLVFQQFVYTTSHEGIFLFCDAVFCDINDHSNRCSQTCHPGS